MTSRVEELQRMCDNINENGGLDSGEWHTALLAQIAQNLAVIADVMMADRREIIGDCEDCGWWMKSGYCLRKHDGRDCRFIPRREQKPHTE